MRLVGVDGRARATMHDESGARKREAGTSQTHHERLGEVGLISVVGVGPVHQHVHVDGQEQHHHHGDAEEEEPGDHGCVLSAQWWCQWSINGGRQGLSSASSSLQVVLTSISTKNDH